MAYMPIPPAPKEPDEAARWQHTRQRRSMLYGAWRSLLEGRVRRAVGTQRAEAWGDVDLSSNVFLQVCSQLSVLYDRPVTVSHDEDPSAAEMLRGILTRAGYEPVMQIVQRDTIGLREMVVRVDAVQREGMAPALTLRRIPPDYVEAWADAATPGQPYKVCETRLVWLGESWHWVREIVEVRDGVGRWVVEDDKGADVTAEVLGEAAGSFPWVAPDGRPVMPYVIFHAAWPHEVWDAWAGEELVEGTLQAAVAWTLAHHALMQASWPQRYAVGLTVPADMPGDSEDVRPRQEVVADPATVIMFQPTEDSNTSTVGQFQPGADPQAMFAAVESYERRVATASGLSASDFVRTSGDPRSGYALGISRAGKREASNRYAPIFQASDVVLMGAVAAAWNGAGGDPLPVDGYAVEYAVLPLSPDEEREHRETVFALLDRGLITRERAAEMLGERAAPETPAAAPPQPGGENE
jgi:hypothetical protein